MHDRVSNAASLKHSYLETSIHGGPFGRVRVTVEPNKITSRTFTTLELVLCGKISETVVRPGKFSRRSACAQKDLAVCGCAIRVVLAHLHVIGTAPDIITSNRGIPKQKPGTWNGGVLITLLRVPSTGAHDRATQRFQIPTLPRFSMSCESSEMIMFEFEIEISW